MAGNASGQFIVWFQSVSGMLTTIRTEYGSVEELVEHPGAFRPNDVVEYALRHGLADLPSVLQSKTAARVNVEIMRTFVRLRRLMATPGELVEQLTKLAETVQWHDEQIRAVRQVLQQMLEQPANPKRRIGFKSDDSTDK